MTLPPLPRILKKKEADWTTTVLRPWLLKTHRQSCAWEVKHTRGKDYLSFNEVKQHQIDNLNEVAYNMFCYKIPDMGEKNPFDGMLLVGIPAYIIIKYPKFFCLISIGTFILEKQRSKRRSLISDRAKDIATIVVDNRG